MEVDLNDYEDIEINELQKISDILERIESLFCNTDTIHENLIEYMMDPCVRILKHHGVNLDEQDF